MHLTITGQLEAGEVLNKPFSFDVNVPDTTYKFSPIKGLDFEFEDNGTDGVVVTASALGFLKTKRTLISTGEHDYHSGIGDLALSGAIVMHP